MTESRVNTRDSVIRMGHSIDTKAPVEVFDKGFCKLFELEEASLVDFAWYCIFRGYAKMSPFGKLASWASPVMFSISIIMVANAFIKGTDLMGIMGIFCAMMSSAFIAHPLVDHIHFKDHERGGAKLYRNPFTGVLEDDWDSCFGAVDNRVKAMWMCK